MEQSTFINDSVLGQSALSWLAIGFAIAAALIILWFLIRKPPMGFQVRILLLFGLGVLPIAAAGTGNVVGFAHTTSVSFCNGCHVMEPYIADVRDPNSMSLPAIHGRVPMFGQDACYACHADYGMFGTIATKVNGMKHLWEYYGEFSDLTIEEALPKIELYQPFTNGACMRCHSTTGEIWQALPDHSGSQDMLRSGELSCMSAGCHGPAHKFSKEAKARAEEVQP